METPADPFDHTSENIVCGTEGASLEKYFENSRGGEISNHFGGISFTCSICCTRADGFNCRRGTWSASAWLPMRRSWAGKLQCHRHIWLRNGMIIKFSLWIHKIQSSYNFTYNFSSLNQFNLKIIETIWCEMRARRCQYLLMQCNAMRCDAMVKKMKMKMMMWCDSIKCNNRIYFIFSE